MARRVQAAVAAIRAARGQARAARSAARAAVAAATPPRRVRRSPEQARALILAAARAAIGEHGPDKVGLKQVAARAGVSHALVTHYYGSYDALVDEVIWSEVRAFRAHILGRLAGATTLPLAEWVGVLVAQYADPARSRVLLWAIMTGRLTGPDAVPRREQGLRQIADVLAARLRVVRGDQAPARAELEALLVVAISAALGYAVAGEALWGALGHDRDGGRDAAFRDGLSALLERTLATPGR
ncbi:MAG: TetR/AcrR family transcriptional regulator [Kofleriaceae bacterium]|jgi:AcrR family transcriptional regulator|nr:TetR/AcrR family transcriptional regulator [Kofleriaceae bacterium]MBP6838370.1 TetR/AcrR family transcriptional regulator [Kofleriaceae bacterium]MBP9202822.1 TetR/AcrR family transcriptional regulator [Kofleriaceae bacterium]